MVTKAESKPVLRAFFSSLMAPTEEKYGRTDFLSGFKQVILDTSHVTELVQSYVPLCQSNGGFSLFR